MLRCSLCHTAPHSLPQAPLRSQSQVLPMHFPGRLSTPLRAHTDLLPTWKSHGKLSPPVQILSAHIITQAKQGLNSTSIQGSTAHHLLVQLPRTDSGFSTCRYPCCSLHSSLELDELLRELGLCYTHFRQLHADCLGHTRLSACAQTHTSSLVYGHAFIHSCKAVLYSPVALSPLNTGGK